MNPLIENTIKGAAAGTSLSPGVGTLIGAGLGLASTALPMLIGNKKRKAKLASAGDTFQTPDEFSESARIAEGMANQGDPNYNRNQQAIERGAAGVINRAKSVSGNVGDILNVVSSANRQQTDASLANAAQDTSYRFNAKRLLAQSKGQLGQAKFRTTQANYGAQQAELQRQMQQQQNIATSGQNIGSDIASYSILNQNGYFGKNRTQSPWAGNGYSE